MMTTEVIKVDAARARHLVAQLQGVKDRIAGRAGGRAVRLVAVSKLKPANDVLALHQAPACHAHFGENYAKELGQKADLLPRTIRWHFIGGLQSGHCKALARIPNLWCVSSVDSAKKAQLLERHRADVATAAATAAAVAPINVHVQVNTSGEASKSGCAPGADTVALCRVVVDECPNLHLLGLMTIGAIARSVAGDGENADFVALGQQRDLVAAELRLERELELSMGMSADFEGAVAMGSAEVRVGSTIFGERPQRADARLTD